MPQRSLRTAHMDWVCGTKNISSPLGVFGKGQIDTYQKFTMLFQYPHAHKN